MPTMVVGVTTMAVMEEEEDGDDGGGGRARNKLVSTHYGFFCLKHPKFQKGCMEKIVRCE